MAYLIGTDEAGYGPSLGPLVISVSVWQTPDGVSGEDMYRLLAPQVTASPGRARSKLDGQVAIADSKALFQSGKSNPGRGLRLLERGLWSAWGLMDHCPSTHAEVWSLLTGQPSDPRHEAFCGEFDDAPAPVHAETTELEHLGPIVRAKFAEADIRLIAIRSRAIFPAEFNDTVARSESKGAALSHWTLGLIADAIEPLDGPISIVCDKHGGRNRYLPLLMEAFPETFIEVYDEGPKRSDYGFGPTDRRVRIAFQVGGESHLPTALASMASKYLRELAMHAFNAFWRRAAPEVQPTAGYLPDGWRFKNDIASAQRALGIDDRVLWRNK